MGTYRKNAVALLAGAVLLLAVLPAAAASDPSLVYGSCDRARQDNPAFTACLEQEMKKLTPLVTQYARAAKDSLRATADEAAAQGALAEARNYREAAEQIDAAQALWEQFREVHCTVEAKQVNGSGAAAAPDMCRVVLTYARLQEIARLAPASLPAPPTLDGRPPAPGPWQNRWPARELARFIFERLDLASFDNSTAPRRPRGQRSTFADLGIRPTRTGETEAVFEDGEWHYSLRVLHKGDLNRDGVEEVLVCFRDAARNGGTYSAQLPLVLQLDDGRVLALAFTQDQRAAEGGCVARP